MLDWVTSRRRRKLLSTSTFVIQENAMGRYKNIFNIAQIQFQSELVSNMFLLFRYCHIQGYFIVFLIWSFQGAFTTAM
jgi:hypothetical protein